MSPSSSSIVLFFDRLHLVSIFLRLLTLSDSPNLSYFCAVLIYLVIFSSYMFSTVLFLHLFSSLLPFCLLLFPSPSLSSCFPPLLFTLVSSPFSPLYFTFQVFSFYYSSLLFSSVGTQPTSYSSNQWSKGVITDRDGGTYATYI